MRVPLSSSCRTNMQVDKEFVLIAQFDFCQYKPVLISLYLNEMSVSYSLWLNSKAGQSCTTVTQEYWSQHRQALGRRSGQETSRSIESQSWEKPVRLKRLRYSESFCLAQVVQVSIFFKNIIFIPVNYTTRCLPKSYITILRSALIVTQ